MLDYIEICPYSTIRRKLLTMTDRHGLLALQVVAALLVDLLHLLKAHVLKMCIRDSQSPAMEPVSMKFAMA